MQRWMFPAFAAVMMLLPLAPVPDFWITQSIYIGLYALVALGLVLLTGVAGLTSFGQAAFVGIGGYAAAYPDWVTLESLGKTYTLDRKEAEVSLLSYLKTLGQKRFVGFLLDGEAATEKKPGSEAVSKGDASGKKWT